MEFFLRGPARLVPKEVPPDKSVGAWSSVLEKTTGVGNVGKSPCEGTYAENKSLTVQGNLREHSVVAHQEDNPTGDCAGIHPLPNAPDPLAVMYSITEMFLKHQTLSTLYFECFRECAVEAGKLSQVSPETQEYRSVHMETYRKSVAIAVAHAIELSESFLVNLEQFKLINVFPPLYRDLLPFDKLLRLVNLSFASTSAGANRSCYGSSYTSIGGAYLTGRVSRWVKKNKSSYCLVNFQLDGPL